MKYRKPIDLDDYVYLRIPRSIKSRIKSLAKNEGSNMTIWIRQNLIRRVEEIEAAKQ